MNKAPHKIKEKSQDAKSIKERVKATPEKPIAAPSQAMLATQEFWREEIQTLKNKNFKNTADALHALVEKVLDRFELTQTERESTHEFLMLLLDTDDEFKEELEKAIKEK